MPAEQFNENEVALVNLYVASGGKTDRFVSHDAVASLHRPLVKCGYARARNTGHISITPAGVEAAQRIKAERRDAFEALMNQSKDQTS